MARFLSRILASGSVLALAAAQGSPTATPPAPVAVFVMRHAEKATNDPRDPDLSDAGRARAGALATMLRHAGVTHCFATELKRTRQTLEPLAAAVGLEVETLAAADPGAFVERLRALPAGSVAVVAGHSNTVPAIVRGLGGELARLQGTPSGDQIPDAEYGRLMLLLLAPPEASERPVLRSLELHAGDP